MKLDMNIAKNVAMLAIGAAGMTFAPHAQACGERHGQAGLAAVALLAPQLESRMASLAAAELTLSGAVGQATGNAAGQHASIVGMWILGFYHPGNVLWDAGIQQFSADGNEVTNDNAFPPAEGNICWGVWERVGNGQYKMKHIGLVFDSNGAYIGRFDFAATLILTDHGGGYIGTYVGDQEDLSGNILPEFHDEGTLKATRFTVD